MFDWSLPRDDLSRHNREGFRPPPHERSRGPVSRIRVSVRRFADLQFGSIWRDLAVLLPNIRGTIADVGSGAQPFRYLLPKDVKYIATDIDEAERKFGYRADDTRYFQGAALPLEDGEADAILCTETLEHVLDTGAFLRELARSLSPGGVLILTVPFAARWHFVPHDYWRFTPSGLNHILSKASFGEVRVYARGGALAVAAYKVLGYVLLLLSGYGRHGAKAAPWRILGLCLMPLAALAALLGNLGLSYPGPAEDTLGYTVLARKHVEP